MQLIVAALAVWQIVEIWHHSSLFAACRARVELQSSLPALLLQCPWCLSVWVGLLCATVLSIDGNVSRVSGLVCLGLAASRLANLGNDVFHYCNRTPRFKLEQNDSDSNADTMEDTIS